MKLKLTAVSFALSALASAAHAQALAPQPSFVDSAPVAAPEVLTTYDTRSTAEVLAAFPQPSSVAN